MISYAIADSSRYAHFESLSAYIHKILQKDPTHILLRDKERESLVLRAKAFAKFKDRAKLLLHTDYELAKALGLYGVHLGSNAFDKIQSVKACGLFCVVSCHDASEILKARELGADMVTYSPIFDVPNKGKAKGVEELKSVCQTIKGIKILALGGITDDKKIEAVLEAGADGFASISYFIS